MGRRLAPSPLGILCSPSLLWLMRLHAFAGVSSLAPGLAVGNAKREELRQGCRSLSAAGALTPLLPGRTRTPTLTALSCQTPNPKRAARWLSAAQPTSP